jgi:hypothetical protein
VRQLLDRELLGEVVVDRAGRGAGLAEHLPELAEHLAKLAHVEPAARARAGHTGHAGQPESAGETTGEAAGRAEAERVLRTVSGATGALLGVAVAVLILVLISVVVPIAVGTPESERGFAHSTTVRGGAANGPRDRP